MSYFRRRKKKPNVSRRTKEIRRKSSRRRGIFRISPKQENGGQRIRTFFFKYFRTTSIVIFPVALVEFFPPSIKRRIRAQRHYTNHRTSVRKEIEIFLSIRRRDNYNCLLNHMPSNDSPRFHRYFLPVKSTGGNTRTSHIRGTLKKSRLRGGGGVAKKKIYERNAVCGSTAIF